MRVVKGEDADPVEPHALFLARRRIDDRLAVRAALAYPETERILLLHDVRLLAEHFGFELLRPFAHGRGERVVNGGRHDPEREGDDQRRRHELPRRHAGRACHDELVAP